MKTKLNKKFWLIAAALAFAVTLFAKPIDVKAALAAPTGLKQTYASTSSFEVEWDENVQADMYGIQISTNKVTWSAEQTTYSESKYFSGATAGTTYYVRVRAYDRSNVPGAWSVLAVDTAPKDVANAIQSDATETSVTVSWPAVSGATGYDVYVGAAASSSKAMHYTYTAAPSVTISKLSNNAKYYVYVYAYRNVANPSIAVYSYSYDYATCVTAPTKPDTLSVIDGNTKKKTLKFSWRPTSQYVNTDGYEIQVIQLKTNGKTKQIKLTSSTGYYNYSKEIKSSLLFSSPSQFRVRSYVTLENGKKVYSSWTSYKTYVPQAVQSKLKPISRSSATLKWKKVTGAQSYTIYYKTSLTGKWKKLKSNYKGTSLTVKYNYYGRSYYYIKANKVKFGKKKLNSASPDKAGYWTYWS